MTAESSQLVATLKRQLKIQGIAYRDVANALELSEASVKRLFSSGRFTVDRLADIAHLAGFTLAELAQEAAIGQARLRTLSERQEKELVSDLKLLLVAVCALNHWTLADIVAAYRLSEAEALKRLLHLDRLGLLSVLPGNRIRLNVARDFDWLPHGPIARYFLEQGLPDFLASHFAGAQEALSFLHGMLTEPALVKLQAEVRRLRQRFAELHEESLASPLPKRRGSGLLLAMREWEPSGFSALRKNRDARGGGIN
jgi:hypothetical protein